MMNNHKDRTNSNSPLLKSAAFYHSPPLKFLKQYCLIFFHRSENFKSTVKKKKKTKNKYSCLLRAHRLRLQALKHSIQSQQNYWGEEVVKYKQQDDKDFTSIQEAEQMATHSLDFIPLTYCQLWNFLIWCDAIFLGAWRSNVQLKKKHIVRKNVWKSVKLQILCCLWNVKCCLQGEGENTWLVADSDVSLIYLFFCSIFFSYFSKTWTQVDAQQDRVRTAPTASRL